MQRLSVILVGAVALIASPVGAQEAHHAMPVHGVPGGVPSFCESPTMTSVTSGAWSSPTTWSTRKVPGANDKVKIASGHTVVYDASSDRRIVCVEVDGRLSFKTDMNTRLHVTNLMVMESGSLEVGTTDRPIAVGVTAEIVISDRPPDPAVDPAQLGTGIEGLGRIRMHGAVKTPTFARLAQEPLAGQTVLTFEQPVTSWKAGDHVVIPDTRQ